MNSKINQGGSIMKNKTGMRDMMPTIITVIIGICVIAGLVIASNYRKDDKVDMFIKESVNQELESSLEDIKQVSVKVSSTDIIVKPTNEDKLSVQLIGDLTVNNKKLIPTLKMERKGKELLISVHRESTIAFAYFKGDVNLIVNVPSTDLEMLSLDGSSSDFSINGIKVVTLSCHTSSGDIEVEDINVAHMVADASSGSIKVTDFQGAINGETSSGDIEIDLNALVGDVRLDASSGDVELTIPSDSNFKFDAEVSSGDIETEFPITIRGKAKDDEVHGTHGSGDYEISMEASSGNLTLKKK